MKNPDQTPQICLNDKEVNETILEGINKDSNNTYWYKDQPVCFC